MQKGLSLGLVANPMLAKRGKNIKKIEIPKSNSIEPVVNGMNGIP